MCIVELSCLIPNIQYVLPYVLLYILSHCGTFGNVLNIVEQL